MGYAYTLNLRHFAYAVTEYLTDLTDSEATMRQRQAGRLDL